MNNTIQDFQNNKYVHLKDFLHKDSCAELTQQLQLLVSKNQTTNDPQCPLSQAVHGAMVFDKLLVDLLPHFEAACGKKLYPTYSYARLYAPGEKLRIHVDRESCEISATLTLGFDGDVWPIYMGNADKSESNKIDMQVGDAVLYQGMNIHHWRKKYKEGKWQAQVFLHYVDANGKYADFKFDKRPSLNLPKDESKEFQQWIYTDILSADACDKIIAAYDSVDKLPPEIGSGQINHQIRNVERVILPTYKDIGGRLAAAGLAANNRAWKFDITHANQAEFLKYPAGGRYTSHIDAFMNPNAECRKLTVLAFLNDDFEGGKFYIQNGHEKYYPPQDKGTIIVFPSFMLHGVEDIIAGTRYSAVCWMVGKFFK